MDSSDRARLALALERLPGVGRVTVGRMANQFGSYEALRSFPREQVLLRLKGLPRAGDLVARLFDPDAMAPHLTAADHLLEDLRRRHIALFVTGSPDWPADLDRLPRASRPVLLYTYGHASLVQHPGVSLFARPPVTGPTFELAQDLLRYLLERGIHAIGGIAHGFDVVVHKISAGGAAGSVMVCHCGLGKIDRSARMTVRESVGRGGVLLSPFPLMHGPFEHDDRERALLQAAIGAAAVFFEPGPGTPEWTAMEWAIETHLPVFGVAGADHPLPPSVHPLHTEVDFEWVEAAVTTARS